MCREWHGKKLATGGGGVACGARGRPSGREQKGSQEAGETSGRRKGGGGQKKSPRRGEEREPGGDSGDLLEGELKARSRTTETQKGVDSRSPVPAVGES